MCACFGWWKLVAKTGLFFPPFPPISRLSLLILCPNMQSQTKRTMWCDTVNFKPWDFIKVLFTDLWRLIYSRTVDYEVIVEAWNGVTHARLAEDLIFITFFGQRNFFGPKLLIVIMDEHFFLTRFHWSVMHCFLLCLNVCAPFSIFHAKCILVL